MESKRTNAGFDLYLEHPFFARDRLIIREKSVFENRAGGTMTKSLDPGVDFTVNQGEYHHVRDDWGGTPLRERGSSNLHSDP